MDTGKVRQWVEGYVKAWNSNDPEDIGALFTDDAAYFTEPYAEPWRGREEIIRGWLEIKDEPGQADFRYQVLVTGGDLGVVKGETLYKDEPRRKYSNLWEIRLNADGRAKEFIEWWMRPE
jgi:uncharacterized protein (TIGR02246 family)